jgi:catalase
MNSKQQNVDMIEQIQLAMMKSTGVKRRGQHFKQHGCLKATFTISDDIPNDLKVGLFKHATTYDAYIRFSNGGKTDDREPDLHGVAIKILDVEGKKILEGQENETTHDFIMGDNPLFFIRTAAEYASFIQDFAQASAQGKRPERFIQWLKDNHPEDLEVYLNFTQQIMDSPLTSQYWGQLPYALGLGDEYMCRYSLIPSDSNPKNSLTTEQRTEDYLRLALAQSLTEKSQPASFDFYIQPSSDTCYEVINNPTVHWNLPTYKVATLSIPAQIFDTDERRTFSENLSFTPWHAIAEHRPLGEVNEIRKQVYIASSTLRHKSNNTPVSEP